MEDGHWFNTCNFSSQEQSPQITPLEDPSNVELIDWGNDEEYLVDKIAKDENFLGEKNLDLLEINQ